MKQKGFTLIELMIVVITLMVIALIVAGFAGGSKSTVSWGVNGMTEMRCIDGYKFVVGERGQARQVMDELGKGVKCQ